MKSFQQFLNEGKKKRYNQALKNELKSSKEQIKSGSNIIEYGNDSEPNSPERLAAIHAMMKRDSDWRKMMRQRMQAQQNDNL